MTNAVVVRARIAEDAGGRLVITELRCQATGANAITGATLRSLRLGETERIINEPTNAAAYRIALTQGSVEVNTLEVAVPSGDDRDLRLNIRPDRKRPDQFYQRVVERYNAAARNHHAPAVALAAANSVPVTTVHRWMKEARRRGLAAPARPSNRMSYR